MDDELITLRARFAVSEGWGDSIACGRGWYPLLADLDAKLSAVDPEYRVYQIKEKFGGLRFYAQTHVVERGGEFISLIRDAEARSFRTCEECGGVGANGQTPSGWWRTLCAECAPEGWISGED